MTRYATSLLAAMIATSLSVGAQGPVFSLRTDAVRVDVSVLDRNRVVGGLTAADFEVLDNGVPQQVTFAGFDDTPVSAMLALDMSGSVRGERLEQLRVAGRRFVSALRPGDSAGLVSFSERVLIRSRLTDDASMLQRVLDQPMAGTDTALFDGVYSAMAIGAEGSGRPILIVFSDGADTASILQPARVLDVARRVGPVVYAVTSPGAERGGFLQELVELTGGRRLDATFDRLAEAFAALVDESRLRYLLSYTPDGVASDGWHDLTVRVKGRPDLEVLARPGYLAEP